jgi:DNA-binding response OmpR family regulator
MILIVDDEPSALVLLEMVLRRDNHVVRKARSGKEALHILEEDADGSCSLVITDIRMPLMDGRELLSRMRAKTRLSSIPVIMCTSSTDRSTVVDMIGHGARDFIAKPFNAAMVLSKVRTALANEEPVIEPRARTTERLQIGPLDYAPLAEVTLPIVAVIGRELVAAIQSRDAGAIRTVAEKVGEPATLFGANRVLTAAHCILLAADDAEAIRVAGILAIEIGEMRSALKRVGPARRA